MKLHFASTDYGDFLQNEPSPLHTTTIAEKCTERMVRDFNYLRANATQPLATFLDYITYAARSRSRSRLSLLRRGAFVHFSTYRGSGIAARERDGGRVAGWLIVVAAATATAT
jgi:hypothetical protein